jgi:hypothetical protein
MRNYIRKNLNGILLAVVILLIILAISYFRSIMDHKPYLISLDTLISFIWTEFIYLINSPTHFITIAILVILFILRKRILDLFPRIKEFSAAGFSLRFASIINEKDYSKKLGKSTVDNLDIQDFIINQVLVEELWQFLIVIDGKSIEVDELLKILKANINHKLPGKVSENMYDYYYLGMFISFSRVFDHISNITLTEGETVVTLKLMPGIRNLLLSKLQEIESKDV